MQALVFEKQGERPSVREVARPEPGPDEVVLRVRACGVCRTDLHILDGELDRPKFPLIPGHQIVGIVERRGAEVKNIDEGDRIGVPWLGSTCGRCHYCRAGRENLCDHARFTGYDLNGGFAEWATAKAQYAFPVPDQYDDVQAAPLLCAGLIGYRAWRMIPDEAERVGFYGFGSAAHILTQVATWEGRSVYAFTRPGDDEGQSFARELGANWAGGSDSEPSEQLDAAIIFAPVGPLVPAALRATRKGATVVCAGIHMSEIPAFSYDLLWGERVLRSVANLERRDGVEFLRLASEIGVRTEVTTFELDEANDAFDALRSGSLRGSAVVHVSD